VVTAFLSYYSGRRALPWWSVVAEAPGRLATWALSGIPGATAAPLGGGATSLGAAFLVGATLAAAPATGERSGSEKASAGIAAVAAGGGPARDRREPRGASAGPDLQRASGPAAGERNAQRRSPGSGRTDAERRLRRGRSGVVPVGEDVAVVRPRGDTVAGQEAPGGGRNAGGGGSGGGDRALKLPEAANTKPADTTKAGAGDDAERPSRGSVPPVVAEPDGGPAVEQPRAEAPTVKVEVPKVELPKVTVPNVELPRVETPPVELEVELPPVEVPKLLPKVQLPKVEVKVPPLRLP
jgi:hypothetical protein